MLKRVLLYVPVAAGLLFAGQEEDKRLNEAAVMFEEVMAISDKAIPQDLLDKSVCAVLVPGLKKGAFIVGARFGRGFLMCRKEGGVGWSAPGAIRVEGGSVGFQIGGSETDVIMLVLNERGADRLFSSKFTVGGAGEAAAGPVGRTASAETDASMRAEILTWSRSRGLFAGVSLQGATLRGDDKVNEAMYGKALDNKTVVKGNTAPPKGADRLLAAMNKYSSRKK